jgi:hypothetical protein
VDRREHHIEDRGADEPGAERPQGIDQRKSEGKDEPCGALSLGVQKWHPKRVCRKGFRRQRAVKGTLLPPP